VHSLRDERAELLGGHQASEVRRHDNFARLNQPQRSRADLLELSPQKRLGQTAVDRNNVSGGTPRFWTGEK
jgi:hypothetical protein